MIEIKKIVSGLVKTNTYVVKCGNEAVVIDAEAEPKLLDRLIGDCTVKGIILTHGHFDHINNLDNLVKEYNTKVYLAKTAKKKLTDPTFNCSRMLGFELICKTSDNDLVAVKDGDELNLFGESIRIIGTPGHTDCCICIKIGNIIFSGDTLFDGCEGRTDIYTSSSQDMANSIKRLNNEYKGTRIYPGHGREGII